MKALCLLNHESKLDLFFRCFGREAHINPWFNLEPFVFCDVIIEIPLYELTATVKSRTLHLKSTLCRKL